MDSIKRNSFHIGMRNIKTALAVFICLLGYRIIGRDGDSMACTAAIICMQGSVEQSLLTGINRMRSTLIGAIFGMIFLQINQMLEMNVALILAPIGIIILIAVCNFMNNPESIVIGCLVMLVILLQYNSSTPLMYSFQRLVDTLFGIVVAIVVNAAIKNPDKREKLTPEIDPTDNPKDENEEFSDPKPLH